LEKAFLVFLFSDLILLVLLLVLVLVLVLVLLVLLLVLPLRRLLPRSTVLGGRTCA
jgi:hypothetical protein